MTSTASRPFGRYALSGFAAVAVVALAVTGCSSTTPAETEPAVEPSTSQAPAETTAPAETNEADIAEPFALAEADPTIDQEFMPEGYVAHETVTDDLGSYVRLTFAPDSPVLDWANANPNLELIEEHGFTVEEAQEAHRAAAAYFMQEFLDGKNLDTDSRTKEDWLAENGQYFTPVVQEHISDESTDLLNLGLATSSYIPLGINRDLTPPGPRMWPTVENVGVEAYKTESGVDRLNVGFTFTNTFSVPQAVAEAAYARSNGGDGSDLVPQNPAMVDEAGMVGMIYSGSLWLNYDPDLNQFTGTRGDVFMYESNGGTEFFTL